MSHSAAAPSLWLAEAANALSTRVRRGEFSAEDAKARFSALKRSPVISHPVETDAAAALALALELKHPAYDCFYLALAMRLDSWVVPADARFTRVVASHPSFRDRVRMLGG